MSKPQRKKHVPPELDITTFLNLMVVLIPFLLISAVFSRITIMQLDVPTTAAGAANKQNVSIEVIIRDLGLEIAVGTKVMAAIPKKGDHYDLQKLSEILIRLKARFPEKEDATILMEPKIEYDNLIQIMDAVRGVASGTPGSGTPRSDALFPKVSIGDAP